MLFYSPQSLQQQVSAAEAARLQMEQMLATARLGIEKQRAEWELARLAAAERVLELEVKVERGESELVRLQGVRRGLEASVEAMKEARRKAEDRVLELEADREEMKGVLEDVGTLMKRVAGGRESVQRAARMLDKDWDVLGKLGRMQQTLVSAGSGGVQSGGGAGRRGREPCPWDMIGRPACTIHPSPALFHSPRRLP